jgi:hypothetical protein
LKNLKTRGHFKAVPVDVDEIKIERSILMIHDVIVWTGFIWLRVITNAHDYNASGSK